MVVVVKAKKPKPKPPIPSDLEEFQALYGSDWLNIVRNPAFIAAAQLLNIRKLKSITNLSDDQIERSGKEILADLRGHLKHEDDLFTLQDQKDIRTPIEEEMVYLSPEQQVEQEELLSKFRDQRRKQHYAAT